MDQIGGIFGGGDRQAAVQPTQARPDPDARGVITYNTYQVIVAREGDDIPAMASRVGLSPDELALHNGLPVAYRPRTGEVLALPRDVGGTPADNEWSPLVASSAIDNAGGISTGPIGTAPLAPGQPNPFNNGQPDTVVDPERHRVQPGETAFSIARRYGVSVTALASWNGLDKDMNVRVNQELLIPIVDQQQVAAAAPINAPGTRSEIAPPPSAADPLPENQDIDAVEAPAPPSLEQPEPQAAPEPAPQPAPQPQSRFQVPIAGATILRDYDPNGPTRSEGIDYGAPAGTPVVAAGDGEVALISEAVNTLGTIVLIRHSDSLITVYGRISNVSLQKGERVTRGQRIGVVAEGNPPNLHFEVRRGTEHIDPAPFLN